MRHRVIQNIEAQAEVIEADHELSEILKQVRKWAKATLAVATAAK